MAARLGLLRGHAPPVDLVHFVEAGHFWRGAGGSIFRIPPAAEREAEMGLRLHSGAQLHVLATGAHVLAMGACLATAPSSGGAPAAVPERSEIASLTHELS